MSARNWFDDEGGAAFPISVPDDADPKEFGMSLRDYFAAKAMSAMISVENGSCLGGLRGYESLASETAYKIADAMLTARKGRTS